MLLMISRDVDKQPIQKSPSGSLLIDQKRRLIASCLPSVNPCEIRRVRPWPRISVRRARRLATLRRTSIYNAIEPEPSGARRPPFPPRGPARRRGQTARTSAIRFWEPCRPARASSSGTPASASSAIVIFMLLAPPRGLFLGATSTLGTGPSHTFFDSERGWCATAVIRRQAEMFCLLPPASYSSCTAHASACFAR